MSPADRQDSVQSLSKEGEAEIDSSANISYPSTIPVVCRAEQGAVVERDTSATIAQGIGATGCRLARFARAWSLASRRQTTKCACDARRPSGSARLWTGG